MKVHSIISNTISEEILKFGHLSIRFRTDGFSLLLEDSNFKPVILNNFSNDPYLSLAGNINACEEWLRNHTLIDGFTGETTLVYETLAVTVVPDEIFSEELGSEILKKSNAIGAGDVIMHRKIKNRPFTIVFSVPSILHDFSRRLKSDCRLLHPVESLLSASDQIDASDHQRGFLLIEVQETMLEILVIQNDQLVLSNRYKLKSGDEVVYHTINTMKQLELDRRAIPVYLAGIFNPDHHSIQLLGRYIKHIKPLPYFIRDIDKGSIQESIILSEATKCE